MDLNQSELQSIKKKPTHVLMVTGVYPTEQVPHAGTFIKSQADSLVAAGLEVEIIHPKPGPVALRYAWATWQVFLKALSGRFDVVHGHYGLWCLVARLQWTTPVVASFLGDDLLGTPTPSGGYSKKSIAVVQISRWLSHHVDAVIVKSEEMRKAIYHCDTVTVIPNGVDFELFRPIPRTEAREALGWEQNRYYVLFGNDPQIYRKGFPLAQSTIECLHQRGIDAELVVANGLPQTKVVQYINASNALLLTSIAEGSPNIVKETMACNVPIVSTAVGDVSQVIGRTQGCSVCPRQPEALAETLEQALQHTEPTTGRGDISHLECPVVAKQVVAVYQEAIGMKMTEKKIIDRKVEEPPLEEKQKEKSKKFKPNKRSILLAAFLLLLLLASSTSFSQYQTYSTKYHVDTTLAKVGLEHLRNAVNFLSTLRQKGIDTEPVTQAQNEFATALSNFSQLNADLKSLPAISTSLPVYGPRLSAALHVLPIATEVSQAGIDACTILKLVISRFHDPLNTHSQGLSTDDFTTIDNEFHQIKPLINQIIQQVNHLQPSDLQLDPRLGKMVALFHTNLPLLQTWLDETEKLLPIVPTLLGIGKPTNYLIELLDSTELRPGGGFIGNYGIATFSGARLAGVHLTDTYLLDNPFTDSGQHISYPAAYTWFDLSPDSWSLRDSNLDADFPTAARYSELNYEREGGNLPLQGVIAITPTLIEQALSITGPIYVPEYHDTVTAQNLIERIHYYQLGAGRTGDDVPSPDGHSSVRKHFTELLGEHFLERFRQLSSSSLPKITQLMIDSLRSKDLQIYLNPSSAESLLQSYHFDSTIQAPQGDSLFVVDANIAPSKANNFITNTLSDQVTIDANGNALHRTTLTYAWLIDGPIFGSTPYRDYLRVYVPPGSQLQTQDGWEPRGSSNAFGRQVWAGFFTLSLGETQTITLVWKIPGAATLDTSGWHYHYLIQRQAGAQRTLHLQVILPSRTRVTNNQGGLSSTTQSLSQTFVEDMQLDLSYAYQPPPSIK